MSEDNALARPYAKAAFDFAVKHNQVQQWSECLQILAQAVTDKRVEALIKNPKVQNNQILKFFESVVPEKNNQYINNFLKLLVYYGRLLALKSIAILFEAFRALKEQKVIANVTSAQPMSEQQQQQLQQALAKRFDKEVVVDYQLDKNLIGGAIIRIGDTVIDGSVQGKLHRLTQHLEMREKICQ